MDRRLFLKRCSAGGATLLGGGWLSAFQRSGGPQDRVLVIGAGVSGLATARVLKEKLGFSAPGQVIVLEARDRVGGRIQTDRSLGVPIDLGATWIHGVHGNPISKLARRFGVGIQTASFDFELHDLQGRLISQSALDSAANKVWFSMGLAYALGFFLIRDQSLAQSLDDVGTPGRFQPGEEQVAGDLMFAGYVDETSQYLQRYSSKTGGYETFGGGDGWPLGGFDGIVQGLAQGVDVRLLHAVQSVDTRGAVARVVTNQGVFEAERVVATLPLGVLKAGNVQFLPALPSALQGSIQALGFGRRHRLILEFPSVFWNDQMDWIGKAGVPHQPYGAGEHFFFTNRVPLTGKSILTVETSAEMADLMEGMSSTQAVARVMQELRLMYGPQIPSPTQVIASEWGTSPHTEGSYSGWVVGTGKQDNDRFLDSGSDRLFFAGEHTLAEYHATVHGALLSGLAAAQRLAAVAN